MWEVVEFESKFIGVVFLVMNNGKYYNYSTPYRIEAQQIADELNGVK